MVHIKVTRTIVEVKEQAWPSMWILGFAPQRTEFDVLLSVIDINGLLVRIASRSRLVVSLALMEQFDRAME